MQQQQTKYHVVRYTKDWVFDGVVSGMGRHRGTWDTSVSKRTAQRWAAKLRKQYPAYNFRIETNY